MKIIGTSEQGLLLTATPNEVAQLLGHYSPYADKCPKLSPGLVFNVSAMYERLTRLSQSQNKLDGARKVLQAIDLLLVQVDPVLSIGEPTVSPEPEKS